MVEGVQPGGQRRIDRVLSGAYLTELPARSLPEIRDLRDEADQEETDLSYLRRLLQGRLDLVRAELTRRRRGDQPAASSTELIQDLARVLGDGERGAAYGSGRHHSAEPSLAGDSRRFDEALLADANLSDVGARTDAELAAAARMLEEREVALSARRRAVQDVLEAVSAEITRRYRTGEADVAALLEPGGPAVSGPRSSAR